MAELSSGERIALSRLTGDMMTLLLLDDAWTELVRQETGAYEHEAADSPSHIADEMARLLQNMGAVSIFIGTLPERMGPDLEARFNALMWGDGLSTTDRDDLRWLVTRAGGVAPLAHSAAAALSTYEAELNTLSEQVERVRAGETIAGDLSSIFRCGLGSGLLIVGGAAIPSAATAGAAAALAAGGTVAAGVLVGATGGIGAIALIVAGIVVMRRQKC